MRFAHWLTVDRHGLSALAMTRCGGNNMGGSVTRRSLSLRGGGGAKDVAIHRVLGGVTDDLSLPSLVHSGSPRAYAIAMTKWEKTAF
ncbi:hypothetical protein N9H45_01655 [Opitutales bacterium]|nr:hypothetical protein [Opitutales bacterium]